MINNIIAGLNTVIRSEKTGRNRFVIITLSVLFLLDYLMFCYHTDKNPLNIFPSIPVLKEQIKITIYIPDIDGKNILRESRAINLISNSEEYIKFLFKEVSTGSAFENTSLAIPVKMYIRKVWIYENTCILDIVPSLIENKSDIIKGSEETFKEALIKTITENIPLINRVILLDRGIPERRLWEI